MNRVRVEIILNCYDGIEKGLSRIRNDSMHDGLNLRSEVDDWKNLGQLKVGLKENFEEFKGIWREIEKKNLRRNNLRVLKIQKRGLNTEELFINDVKLG